MIWPRRCPAGGPSRVLTNQGGASPVWSRRPVSLDVSAMSKQQQQQVPLTPFENALAGALGGVFSKAVIYPLDTV